MTLRSYLGMGHDGRTLRVICPNAAAALSLIQRATRQRMSTIMLASRQAFIDALCASAADRIATEAAFALPARYSARPPKVNPETTPRFARIAKWLAFAMPLVAAVLGIVLYPLPTLVLPPLLMAPVFIIAGLAVLTATLESGVAPPPAPPPETRQLPRYSILVPLYREANVVETLVSRLMKLEYPRGRIEAMILVETEDRETLSALRAAQLPGWIHIIAVPDGAPRTKPRALNAALPFCTGDLIVVFDAEDAPEPDQLLRAAALFQNAPPDLGCVQARLAISNPNDNFFTRRFAIDYATLFDCVKAGSAKAGWPVPLGGSSNHFRLSVLRQVGGWDAWNVTEDADLGLRLARLGWQVADLPSTTWEEAPNQWLPWLNQRTRWMKGWLQTLFVHGREPRRILRELGAFRTIIAGAMAIAVLIGALLYPAFAIAVLARLLMPEPLGGGGLLLLIADSMLVLALVVAFLAELIPPIIALGRRRALYLFPWIFLAPVTHIMVSIAAWRALVEFMRAPFHWHKTMHGRAKSSGGLHAVREINPGARAGSA